MDKMDKILEWLNYMIGVFLWICTWEVWRAAIHSTTFGKKLYVLICFLILVLLTVYIFNSDTIGWTVV